MASSTLALWIYIKRKLLPVIVSPYYYRSKNEMDVTMKPIKPKDAVVLNVETSTLTSRKKEKADRETTVDSEAGKNSITDRYDSKHKESGRVYVTICLFIFAIHAAIFVYSVPVHIRARSYKLIDEQFKAAAEVVETQRKQLTQRFNILTTAIEEEEALKHKKEIEILKAKSEVDSMKHTKEIKKLKSDSAAAVKKLKKLILIHQKELDKVKKLIGQKEYDVEHFCPECEMEVKREGKKKQIYKCGQRLQYVVRKYKHTEDVAKETIMEKFPSCKNS